MMRILGRAGMTPPEAVIRPYLNPSPRVQPPNLKNSILPLNDDDARPHCKQV